MGGLEWKADARLCGRGKEGNARCRLREGKEWQRDPVDVSARIYYRSPDGVPPTDQLRPTHRWPHS